MTILHLKPRAQRHSIDIAYLDANRFADARWVDPSRILAAIQFGGGVVNAPTDTPLINVPLENLGQESLLEVWQSSSEVRHGQWQNIHYSHNDEFLFAAIRYEEFDSSDLVVLSHKIYADILGFIQKMEYPHLLRMWNYLADINREQDGLERYRAFCKGRYQGFAGYNPGFEQSLPAASAVGTHQPGLCVYFLAGRSAGIPLANPRQVNAYEYPRQYGPRSPSFSRALINVSSGKPQFYIAGTASIVGHETQHPDDVGEQTLETLRNFSALHDCAREEVGINFVNDARQTLFKVFIRNKKDYPLIQQVLSDHLGIDGNVLYLHADICRRDLLVEIEAVYLL